MEIVDEFMKNFEPDDKKYIKITKLWSRFRNYNITTTKHNVKSREFSKLMKASPYYINHYVYGQCLKGFLKDKWDSEVYDY